MHLIPDSIRLFSKQHGVKLRLHTMDGLWLLTASSGLTYKSITGLNRGVAPTDQELMGLVTEVAKRESDIALGPVWDGKGFDF